MKTLTLLFLFSATTLIGQTTNSFEDFLDKNYQGGHKEFLTVIYSSIKYPAKARTSCRNGKLKTKITISPEGAVNQIEFLNKLGHGIEKEVASAINLTTNNWLKADSIRTLEFTTAFQIGLNLEINGDVKIAVFGVGGASSCSYTPNEELVTSLMKQLKKKRYKKARKICTELLRRDPDSDHFKNLSVMIEDKLRG